MPNNFYVYDINFSDAYVSAFASEVYRVTDISEPDTPTLYLMLKYLNKSHYDLNCYKENHIIIPENSDYQNGIEKLAKINAVDFVNRVGSFWTNLDILLGVPAVKIKTKNSNYKEEKDGDNTSISSGNNMSENTPVNSFANAINTPNFKSESSGNNTYHIDEEKKNSGTESENINDAYNVEKAFEIINKYGIANIIEDLFKRITLEYIGIL